MASPPWRHWCQPDQAHGSQLGHADGRAGQAHRETPMPQQQVRRRRRCSRCHRRGAGRRHMSLTPRGACLRRRTSYSRERRHPDHRRSPRWGLAGTMLTTSHGGDIHGLAALPSTPRPLPLLSSRAESWPCWPQFAPAISRSDVERFHDILIASDPGIRVLFCRITKMRSFFQPHAT
jgi:hypothetical protein